MVVREEGTLYRVSASSVKLLSNPGQQLSVSPRPSFPLCDAGLRWHKHSTCCEHLSVPSWASAGPLRISLLFVVPLVDFCGLKGLSCSGGGWSPLYLFFLRRRTGRTSVEWHSRTPTRFPAGAGGSTLLCSRCLRRAPLAAAADLPAKDSVTL